MEPARLIVVNHVLPHRREKNRHTNTHTVEWETAQVEIEQVEIEAEAAHVMHSAYGLLN